MAGTDNKMSKTDKQIKLPLTEQLRDFSTVITYLQLAQVQLEPQLQLTQVQSGLLHFTFTAFCVLLLIDVVAFMTLIF
jgi:hypothetical protein